VLNMLGVFYELCQNEERAWQCYRSAWLADHRFTPAMENMQRLYDLRETGRTTHSLRIGDALTDLWLARATKPPVSQPRLHGSATPDARYAAFRVAEAPRYERRTT
jgi:hypothetical protein